jgi:transcription elongation factor Elf1
MMDKEKLIKCPKCKKKQAQIVEGRYPWKAYYLVCKSCGLSQLLQENENPSFRHYGKKEEVEPEYDEYYEYYLLA